jgi:hypothetical protein
MKKKIEFTGEAIEMIHGSRDGARLGLKLRLDGKYEIGSLSSAERMCSIHHASINSGQATQTVVKDFRGKAIYSGVRDND